MPDGFIFSGLYYVATGKTPMEELEEDEMAALPENGRPGPVDTEPWWGPIARPFDKKRRGRPNGTPNADEEPDGIPDEEFGGDHFMGTGTYEAKNQEQAQALYGRLPQGSRADAGPEPPMSTTGKSYYEHNWLTGRNTDPREQGSSGDPSTPNA